MVKRGEDRGLRRDGVGGGDGESAGAVARLAWLTTSSRDNRADLMTVDRSDFRLLG